MESSKKSRQSTRTIRKNAELSRMFIKEEVRARCKKVSICVVSFFLPYIPIMLKDLGPDLELKIIPD